MSDRGAEGSDGAGRPAAERDTTAPSGTSGTGDKPVDGVDNSISGGKGTAGHTGMDQCPATHPEQSAADSGDPTGGAGEQLRGPDLARSALQAAQAAARDAGRATPGSRQRRAPGRAGQRRRRGWSGSRSDNRDPQPLGRLASRLVADRGWAARVSGGQVFGRWEQLVGEEVAEHARPVALREGELTVQAGSTAWATQLRLLQRQLLGRIAAGVGRGVVTRLRILGPAAPSWHYGPRHVRGRGPRDTYG